MYPLRLTEFVKRLQEVLPNVPDHTIIEIEIPNKEHFNVSKNITLSTSPEGIYIVTLFVTSRVNVSGMDYE